VDDIISDIDDAISQVGLTSQFRIEVVDKDDNDDDDDDDDDDDSSFEEEVLEEMETSYDEGSVEQDAYDEELLEEEEVTMANGGEETELNGSFAEKRSCKQYDRNHYCDMIQDEIKDDFNPLSVLEKESQQQRKKTIDVNRTRKMSCVLDTFQSMKRSNGAAISGLRFSKQGRKQRSELTASSSQIKRTGKSGRELSYLIEDEESVFEESICSESSASEFSVSISSVSTSTDAQKNIQLPLEHQVKTPRVNNRKGVLLSTQQPNVEVEIQKRNLLLGLVPPDQELGGAVSIMLHSSSMKGNDVKVAPQASQGLEGEDSVSSKGTSKSSSKGGGRVDSTNIGNLNSIAPTTAATAYQPPIIMDSENAYDIISSTKSVASRKSLSSKSTASSTAKRARQLVSDIESGSQYLDHGVKIHQTWSKRRSLVLIGGLLTIVGLCAAALLAVLHILPRQTKNDVKDIRDSETPNKNNRGIEEPIHAPKNESDELGIVLGMDPSAWPTYQPPVLKNTLESVWLYYANWGTSKCTEEDSSTKEPWDMGYETEVECCVANFGWDENRNCDSGENDTASNGGGINIVLSTPASTILTDPTADIAAKYYANFIAGKCVQDYSTQTNGKYQESYLTEEECCQFNFSWDANGMCYMDGGSTTAPTALTNADSRIYEDGVPSDFMPT
jgi:hypothetical protein